MAHPPALLGIVETSLYVSDLQQSHAFYEKVFGFRQIYAENGRMIGLAVQPGQVLLLFRKGASEAGSGAIPGHDAAGQIHLAFGIDPDSALEWKRLLSEAGVVIESDMPCGGNGRSLYFRDPDGHLLELVTRGCWEVF